MKKIRWGIIGCGDVTEVKSGPGFQKAENSELVAVMRRNGDLAKDYAERHGVPRWYDDGDALIHDPDVNAVYIATPPNSHKEYTLKAAAAGKPVYVEKPMALNFAECQAMIAACAAANVPLFVAFYRRALPRFLKIKDMIQSGSIGEVRYVNIICTKRPRPVNQGADLPWRVLPEISGGGIFVDIASHMLDLLDWMLTPIADVRGFAANQGGGYLAEDIVSGSFQFESGVIGSGVWSFTAFEDVDRTEIVGTHGKIVYATFDDSPVEVITENGKTAYPLPNPTHIQQPVIQTIVNELNGMGKCPSSGESAARTSHVMDRLLMDYYRASG